MTQVTDAVLKSTLEDGDQPTQQDFIDLVDSKANLLDLASTSSGSGADLLSFVQKGVYYPTANTVAAIQAQIDAAYAADGGVVMLVPGTDYASAGTTLYLKRNVWLASPQSLWNLADVVAGVDQGTMPRIVGSSGMTADLVSFDFDTLNGADSPWNSGILGIALDGSAMASGAGLSFITPTAGTGPASNGKIQGGLNIRDVAVLNMPGYGIDIQRYVNGVTLRRVLVNSCGNHGIQNYGTDTTLDHVWSYNNTGANLWNQGASMRVMHSDFWQALYDAGVTDSGYGIYDEGNYSRYIDIVANLNERDGIYLAGGSTVAGASRKIVFVGGWAYNNSTISDNTYADVHVGSYSGAVLTGIKFLGFDFSYASASANKPAWSLKADVGQTSIKSNILTGCSLSTNGLSSSATASMDGNALKSFRLVQGSNSLGSSAIENRATKTVSIAPKTFTADADTDILTIAGNHNHHTGTLVQLTEDNTLPAPLAELTDYYVIRISATEIQLATTSDNAYAGTAINLTTDGVSTNTMTIQSMAVNPYEALAYDGEIYKDVTILNPKTQEDGQIIDFLFEFKSTGGWTITWDTQYLVNWTPTTTTDAFNSIRFRWNSHYGRWVQVGYSADIAVTP